MPVLCAPQLHVKDLEHDACMVQGLGLRLGSSGLRQQGLWLSAFWPLVVSILRGLCFDVGLNFQSAGKACKHRYNIAKRECGQCWKTVAWWICTVLLVTMSPSGEPAGVSMAGMDLHSPDANGSTPHPTTNSYPVRPPMRQGCVFSETSATSVS